MGLATASSVKKTDRHGTVPVHSPVGLCPAPDFARFRVPDRCGSRGGGTPSRRTRTRWCWAGRGGFLSDIQARRASPVKVTPIRSLSSCCWSGTLNLASSANGQIRAWSLSTMPTTRSLRVKLADVEEQRVAGGVPGIWILAVVAVVAGVRGQHLRVGVASPPIRAGGVFQRHRLVPHALARTADRLPHDLRPQRIPLPSRGCRKRLRPFSQPEQNRLQDPLEGAGPHRDPGQLFSAAGPLRRLFPRPATNAKPQGSTRVMPGNT